MVPEYEAEATRWILQHIYYDYETYDKMKEGFED